MSFETFASAQSFLLWSVFVIALILGAVANKTNFCTMGAVSDWVNIGDTGRFRAWLFAIAIAVIGVTVLEKFGLVSATDAFPPYRGNNFIWAENLFGGLMFGIGMTLASGCGNKTLIRLGGGNIKSIFVLLIIGVIAYFMINPFPGTDQTLFTLLFYPWIRPLAIQLGGSQDLGSLLGGAEKAADFRLIIGLLLGLGLVLFAFISADFRGKFDNILGGLVVGLTVLGVWYFSSNVAVNIDGDQYSLTSYIQEWDLLADSDAGKPEDSRSLSPQSFTFINPVGQTLGYGAGGFQFNALTVGIMAVLGVIAGSLLWSVLSGSFRIEWFASFKDFFTHVIGAILMGFGGVLAMGCTIGQGVTGVSTLALGSFIALIAIILGSALTMKVQYYKMVYEEEASFGKALVASLADLKLLPNSLRKLDKV